MTSWLFVPIDLTGRETQKATRVGELKSHATKFAHARIKQKRLKALKGSLTRFPTQKPLLNDEPSARGPSNSWRRRQYTFDSNQNDRNSTPAVPPIRTILGQGKPEPFCSHQIRELPAIMQESLEYAYEVLWPTNSPALQGDLLRTTINSWRTGGLESQLVFFSQVSNAATLCLAKSTDPAAMRMLSSIRILYQGQAIHLIQEALDQLKGPPSTSLITCIMNIHGQGAQMYESIPHQTIPESPIFKGFNLKHYGRFAPPRVHFPALILLVRQRGGLTSLPPGVADPMQLADLCAANIHLTAPTFPLLSSIAELADIEKDYYDIEAQHLLKILGSGFRLRGHGIDQQLMQQLLSACRLTAGIDEIRRKAAEKFPLNVLVVKAIAFQHRMLSLPPAAMSYIGPGRADLEDYIHQITRLTTFIYSDLVIFPTSEARQGRQRLAGLLKDCLLLCFEYHLKELLESSIFDDLLLWSLILGGVASSNTPNREWFIMHAFEHISARQISWDTLQAILRTFLYLDCVLAVPVTNLWVEAFQSQQLTVGFNFDVPALRYYWR